MKKISRRSRGLLLASAAIVVLLGVLAALLLFPEPEEEDTSLTEHHELFVTESDNMAGADVQNKLAEFTLHFHESPSFTVGGYDLEADETSLYNTMNHVCNLTARQKIDMSEADLSLYGLEDPAAHVVLRTLDGRSYGFSVGNLVAGEMGYYILPDDKSAVYVVNTNMVEYFTRSPYYFLTKSVISVTEEELDTIVLSGQGIDGQIVLTAIEEYTDGVGNRYTYRLTSEDNVLAEPGLNSRYFSSLLELNSSQIFLHDADDEELASCGLADPLKVLTFTAGDQVTTIRVGNLESGHYLVQINDEPIIYTVQEDALPWVNAVLSDFYNTKSGIPAISTLTSFTVKGDGVSVTFDIDATDKDNIAITCGGKELTYTNMKNFYRYISLISGETFTESYDSGAEEVCAMTFNGSDGSVYRVRFLKAGVRRLYFEVNGTCHFTLSQTVVDKILSDAKKVANGESTNLQMQ